MSAENAGQVQNENLSFEISAQIGAKIDLLVQKRKYSLPVVMALKPFFFLHRMSDSKFEEPISARAMCVEVACMRPKWSKSQTLGMHAFI